MPDRTQACVIDANDHELCWLAFNMEPLLPGEWIRKHIQLDPSVDELYRVIGVLMPQRQLTLRVRPVTADELASDTDVLIGLPINPPPPRNEPQDDRTEP